LRQSGGWLGRGPSGDGRAQLLAGIPAVLVAAGVASPAPLVIRSDSGYQGAVAASPSIGL